MLLPPEPQMIAPRYRATTQEQEIFAPTTGAVVEAYVLESLTGIGTYKADIFASDVKEAEQTDTRITKEQFDQSPLYRPGMEYYPEMTERSMSLIAQFHDDHATKQEIIARASGGQTALGMTAGILTGTLEPKNLAIGIATAGALGPILGAAAPLASQVKRIVNMRRANSAIAARAGYGATEGLVAAAIAEPSNRYSAKTLQQDYTMLDTFFNIATSSVLGGAIGAVSPVIEARMAREPNKVKAYDTTLMEHDTALNQLSTGQKVDVSHVERVMAGEAATKPIANTINDVEVYVIKNIDSDFISKAIPEVQAIGAEFDGVRRVPVDSIELSIPKSAIIPESASTKGPIEIDSNGKGGFVVTDGNHRLMEAKKRGDKYIEAAFFSEENQDLPNGELVKRLNDTRAKQIDSALMQHGGIMSIARRMDAENKAAVNKSVLDSVNPENDTAIDYAVARELDAYNATLKEDDAAIKESLEKYGAELEFMMENNMLSEDEVKLIKQSFSELNEDNIKSGYDALLACLTRG